MSDEKSPAPQPRPYEYPRLERLYLGSGGKITGTAMRVVRDPVVSEGRRESDLE